jgi:cation:H+ antiporter
MLIHMDWVLLVISLFVILAGAELFTNGVEWVGEGFGLSEGAVGSVLAAVGTALPETILPIIAIASGHASGEEIGVGAILGAPFMLTTLAMVVIAVAILIFARGGRRSRDLDIDRGVIRQDLGYFLVMYALAVVAGLLHVKLIDYGLAIVLVVGYGYYVRRHFQTPGEVEMEGEAATEIKPLYVWGWLRRVNRRLPVWSADGATAAPFVQVAPEKFNSVLWVRRRKDTLAMGNMTGAMVFQSSFPVTIGLLFTPWELTGEALVAALVALAAGSVLYLTLRFRGRLSAPLLLLQGVFYLGYVGYVLTRL